MRETHVGPSTLAASSLSLHLLRKAHTRSDELAYQRLVENTLIKGGVVPLLQHGRYPVMSSRLHTHTHTPTHTHTHTGASIARLA